MSTKFKWNEWVATSSGISCDVFQIVRQAPKKLYYIQWRTRHCTKCMLFICVLSIRQWFARKSLKFWPKIYYIDFRSSFNRNSTKSSKQYLLLMIWISRWFRNKANKWTQNTISSSFCNKRKKKKKKRREKKHCLSWRFSLSSQSAFKAIIWIDISIKQFRVKINFDNKVTYINWFDFVWKICFTNERRSEKMWIRILKWKLIKCMGNVIIVQIK